MNLQIRVHVQCFADLDSDRRSALLANLIADDQLHLSRVPEARSHQLLCRGLLRELLGDAAGLPPSRLAIIRADSGKPRLSNAPLAFNLSHSAEACAIAWCASSRDQPLDIGIDIEDRNRILNTDRLARHAFSSAECALWLAGGSDHTHWLGTWTRKEAILKAHGMGIRTRLAAVETAAGDDAPCDHPLLGRWRFRSWVSAAQVFSIAWPVTAGEPVITISGGESPPALLRIGGEQA